MGTKALAILDLASGIMNDEGNPLASGKVYFYTAGTLTAKDIYTDRDKTTASSNPVILDIYGRAELYGDGLYKMVITDSDDVTLWDLDNVELVPLEGGSYDDVTINPTTPAPVTGSLLKFTTSLEDSNGDTITEFSDIQDYINFEATYDDLVDFDSSVSSKDPVYWDSTSSTWMKADLAGNDPEAFCVTVSDDGDGTYSGKIVYNGNATGVSGLSDGAEYYLDTSGGLTVAETSWSIGKAISTTEIVINLRQTSTGQGSGSVNLTSLLAVIASIREKNIYPAIPYVNYLLESAEKDRVTILLHTSYTGGTTTLKLTEKIFIEDGNYVPIYIMDDTTGNYDEIWLDSLTGETTGEYTYSLVESVSNSYTTTNEAYVSHTTGEFDEEKIKHNSDSTGDVLLNAESLKVSYVRKEQIGTATFEMFKVFGGDKYPADLTNYAASSEILFDDDGADVSANFKNDNYFALVKLLNEDNDELSYIYDELRQYRGDQDISWYIFQMDANGSYSSPDVTASVDKFLDTSSGEFSTSLPTISDTENWFVVRINGFLEYLAGAKTLSSFTEIYPTDFLVDNLFADALEDDFTRSDGTIGNDWTAVTDSTDASASKTDWAVVSNTAQCSSTASTHTLKMYRNKEGYGKDKLPIEVSGSWYIVTSTSLTNQLKISLLTDTTAIGRTASTSDWTESKGISLLLVPQEYNVNYANLIKIQQNGTTLASASSGFATDVSSIQSELYYWKFRVEQNGDVKGKCWLNTDSEPEWQVTTTGTDLVEYGNYFSITGAMQLGTTFQVDDVIISMAGEKYIMNFKKENLSNIEKYAIKDKNNVESSDDSAVTYNFGGGLIE